MPETETRKYTPRFTYGKKSGLKKRKVTTEEVEKSLSKRIKKIESEVERKYFDFSSGGYQNLVTEASGNMTFACLNTPIQGAGQLSRLGTEIMMDKLRVRLSFKSLSTTLTESRIRFMIFWYKNQNTLVPTAGQVLDLTLPAITFAFMNQYFDDSFKILMDKTFVILPATNLTATTVVPGIRIFDFDMSVKRKTKFAPGAGTGPSGAPADISDNGLWIAFSTSTAAGQEPQFDLSTRVFFTDA